MLNFLILAEYIEKIFTTKGGKVAKNENLVLQSKNKRTEKIASLARLVQKMATSKGVCCCIYIDEKNDVWYSTNSTKKSSYEEFINSISFIRDYIVNGNKEIFLREAFEGSNVIYQKMGRDQKKIDQAIKSGAKEGKEETILRLVNEGFYKFNSSSLVGNSYQEKVASHFEQLKKRIHDYLRSLPKGGNMTETIELITPVSLYIEDFINIYDSNFDNSIVDAFKEGRFRRIDCEEREIGSLHCEQKMLEHISKIDGKKISAKVYYELKDAVAKGRFVVSKLCCGYCYSVFSNLEKVAENSNTSLKSLGHSASFFRGWSSPTFERNQGLFDPLRKSIHQYLNQIRGTEDAAFGPLIENSETERIVNQVIIPGAFLEQ